MITEAIVNVLVFIVLGVVKLFPTIPEIDLSFMDGLIRVLSLVDSFVSLRVLAACLVTLFVFMHLSTVWSMVMWVVRKLPMLE